MTETVGAGATYAMQLLSSSFTGRTGLFTLEDGEWVNYSATLDDHRRTDIRGSSCSDYYKSASVLLLP